MNNSFAPSTAYPAALLEPRTRHDHRAAGVESGASSQAKKRVLFIPASIRSHIVPTLYLAELLAREYDIFYAVTSPVLAEIVAKNGFIPVLNTVWRVAIGMESSYLASQQRPAGFWPSLRAVCSNEIYWHRKRELDELLAQLEPAVVIIDVFSSTDFLALYHHETTVRLLFCNPMPSTYRVGNLPIVSEASWPALTNKEENAQSAKFYWLKALRQPWAELYQLAMRRQLKKLGKLIYLSPAHQVIDTPFTRLFTNVPELVLAPLEFELSPMVRKPHQHYLGLSIREARTDTELDAEFMQKWPEILAKRQAGQRLIYCSFGTFYTGSNKALLTFVTNLLDVVRNVPNVQLVCSVNNLVVETLQAQHAGLSNAHFFRRVPQLTVLQVAAAHITHGGLGSVKESICYGVPMLVYPLDAHYDQPGNGLKVEHHGLGLRGNFEWERAASLQAKLLQLLNNDTFRTAVVRFRDACATQYSTENVTAILQKLLSTAAL